MISPLHALHFLFGLASLGGVALAFLPQGAWDWWNPLWVLLGAAVAYASLAAGSGLAAARVTAAALLAGFAAVLLAALVSGVMPLMFTAHVGPRLGGVLPVLPVVLAFSVLVLGQRAVASLWPAAGRWSVMAGAAVVFTGTLANAAAFLSGVRLWWLWNPLGGIIPAWVAPAILLGAFVCAALLAWAIPAPTRLRRGHREVVFLILLNLPFLAATVRELSGR